jgi:predicted GIY-YIG superfamily endonuclease
MTWRVESANIAPGKFRGLLPVTAARKLVYYEYCGDVLAAVEREKQLKRWSRSKKVALIATVNPHWRDLAPEVLGEEQESTLIRSSPA